MKLVVSLLDVDLAADLKQVLNGEYQLLLAGKQSEVKVEVLIVVQEGMGALGRVSDMQVVERQEVEYGLSVNNNPAFT